MKNIAAVLAITILTLTGCAHAPAAPTITACGRAPSSYLTNDAGVPSVAIYTCYRTDGLVAYQGRQLTDYEVKQAKAALATGKSNPSSADPCADLSGKAYTSCRLGQSAGRHQTPLKAVK